MWWWALLFLLRRSAAIIIRWIHRGFHHGHEYRWERFVVIATWLNCRMEAVTREDIEILLISGRCLANNYWYAFKLFVKRCKMGYTIKVAPMGFSFGLRFFQTNIIQNVFCEMIELPLENRPNGINLILFGRFSNGDNSMSILHHYNAKFCVRLSECDVVHCTHRRWWIAKQRALICFRSTNVVSVWFASELVLLHYRQQNSSSRPEVPISSPTFWERLHRFRGFLSPLFHQCYFQKNFIPFLIASECLVFNVTKKASIFWVE